MNLNVRVQIKHREFSIMHDKNVTDQRIEIKCSYTPKGGTTNTDKFIGRDITFRTVTSACCIKFIVDLFTIWFNVFHL